MLLKYLNENEDDLLLDKKCHAQYSKYCEQLNLFDLFMRQETSDLIDEETELECDWPEQRIGRKFLLDFESFNLNISLPLKSELNNASKSNSASSIKESIKCNNLPLAINVKLFKIYI